MVSDLASVAWREWLEWQRQYGSRRAGWLISLAMLAVFGLILPIQLGRGWFDDAEAIYAWLVLPIVVLLRSMGDTFAGERERHTLETLLATRIPDRAVYLGKMLVPLAYAWLFTQAVLFVALVPANVVAPSGAWQVYSPPVLAAGLCLSLLAAGYAAAGGVYLSLRSPTVESADQSMFLLLLVFGAAVAAVRGACAAADPAAGLLAMAPVLAAILAAADAALVVMTARLFTRNRALSGLHRRRRG